MQKKLTITLDAQVYKGLHTNIGKGRISKFIEDLVRPYTARLPRASPVELPYRGSHRDIFVSHGKGDVQTNDKSRDRPPLREVERLRDFANCR